MSVTIPAGINTPVINRGMDPAELVLAVDSLIALNIDAYVVPDKFGNLDIVSAVSGIIGRIEFRNDLGLVGAARVCMY